ncbi:MAG: hypothetical protein M1812_002229 [Candelaria pacifica]|nr:MAG: hypothetical protein M1812_002229 [Candelaria pacifica]
MAAVASNQQRRRPATYGKTSRKRLYGDDYKASLTAPQSVDSRHWSNEFLFDRSEKEASTSATQIHSDVDFSTKTPGQGSSSGAASGSKLYRSRNRAEGVQSRVLRTSRYPTATASAVFDIPSSSDDDSFTSPMVPKLSSKRPNGLSEKSRSAARILGAQGSGDRCPAETQSDTTKSCSRTQTVDHRVQDQIVFNDKTRQRHIATEESVLDNACESRSRVIIQHGKAQLSDMAQNLKEGSRDLTNKLDGSNPLKRPAQNLPQENPQFESSDSAQGDEQARQADEKIPKKRRRLAEDKAHIYKGISAPAALQGMLPKEGSALQDHSRHHCSPLSRSHRSRLPANIQVRTTPPPLPRSNTCQGKSKLASITTTPRQARMWNELLDDKLSNHSPSHLKLKQLSISGCESSTIRLKGAVKNHSAAAATIVRQRNPPQRPRQRLIDAIGIDSTDSHSQRELSGDESEESASIRSLSPANNDHADTSATSGSQTASLDPVPNSNTAQTLIPPTVQQGGPKVTYARQRSHLTEDVLREEDLFQAPLDMGPGSRPSNRRRAAGGASPAPKPSQGLEGATDLAEESNNGAIRSIHELRKAGDNKRFLDSMDAIFEDIEVRQPSTISRRRNSLIDISSKLADRKFSIRFLEHCLDQRLFVDLTSEYDIIVGFLLASAMLFVIQDGAVTRTVSYLLTQGAVQLVVRLLEAEQDIFVIARQRQSNISKVSQGLLRDFRELLQHATIWGPMQPSEVSPQTVALKCLEIFVRQSRGSGAAINVLSQAVVDKLVQILKPCAMSTAERERSTTQAIQLENSLSILELCTMNGDIEEAYWSPGALSGLSETLSGICSWQGELSRHIQTMALRLTINLTNNNAPLCDVFATSKLIGATVSTIIRSFDFLSAIREEGERLLAVDQLILALGLLINFAEWSDTSRIILMEPRDRGTTLLDELLELFGKGAKTALLADSMEETHSNVAFGYLSVLLGNTCQNPTARIYTCSKLPGGTLQSLIAAVEEFLQYHKTVDAELYEIDDGTETDLQAGFTDRLQSVVDRLKASEV